LCNQTLLADGLKRIAPTSALGFSHNISFSAGPEGPTISESYEDLEQRLADRHPHLAPPGKYEAVMYSRKFSLDDELHEKANIENLERGNFVASFFSFIFFHSGLFLCLSYLHHQIFSLEGDRVYSRASSPFLVM